MKIALFGTSADPPTAAHQTILQCLADHYDQVAVWASDNPLKKKTNPFVPPHDHAGITDWRNESSCP